MNMAKSTLHLERDRPPSHKGTRYGIQPPTELSAIDVADMPPVFDNDMAAMMRSVAIVLTPGIVIPKSHRAMIIPIGPTLQAWYHLGCQTPWKQQAHLAVVIHPGPSSPAATIADPSTVAAQIAPQLGTVLSDKIKDPDHRQCFISHQDGNHDNYQLLQCNLSFEPHHASLPRRAITLFMYIQIAVQPPLGYKQVLTDGGVVVHVKSDKTQLIKEIQEWYKSRPVTKKNPIARRLAQNAHTHATSKLDMASSWRYDERTRGFYKPGTARLAFMWPPSFATLKVLLILLVVLGVAYVLGVNIIPGLYSPAKAAQTRNPALTRSESDTLANWQATTTTTTTTTT